MSDFVRAREFAESVRDALHLFTPAQAEIIEQFNRDVWRNRPSITSQRVYDILAIENKTRRKRAQARKKGQLDV